MTTAVRISSACVSSYAAPTSIFVAFVAFNSSDTPGTKSVTRFVGRVIEIQSKGKAESAPATTCLAACVKFDGVV